MHCRFCWTRSVAFIPVLAALSLSGCSTTTRITTSVTSVFTRTEKSEAPAEGTATTPRKDKATRQLTFRMETTPEEVVLSDTRQIKLRLLLENQGKRFTQLRFPTTQRIEILVRDDKDRLVTQWSEDRAYEQVPGFVGINPGERVEYNTTISTRDLQAGRTYKILAFLPNYDELRAEKTITPKP